MRKRSSKQYNKPTILAENLLLVEGPDEFQFIRFLRKREDLQIHVYEGKDQLRIELKTLKEVEGFSRLKRIVIMRDADADPDAARDSVLSQWSNAFEEAKPHVGAEQWFVDAEGREWSIWITPDPSSPGDLEELLWRAVPESCHKTCVESMIDSLEGCDPIPFGSKTKAFLFTWLSTQQEPIKELYAALDPSNSLFDPADPVFLHHGTLIDNI